MHLYERILETQNIKNASSEWSDYRQNLTQYILSSLPENAHIAIVGAGRCNDIDLNTLSPFAKKLTLIDWSQQALEEACLTYSEIVCPVQLVTTNLVGITEVQYKDFIDTLVAKIRMQGMVTDLDALTNLAHTLLDHYMCYIPNELTLGDECYDFVIAIGLHSQLLSTLELIWSLLLQTIQQEEATFRQRIITLNHFFVTRLNDALIRATKKKALIGYEVSRIGRSGTIQGAYQCQIDIDKRVLEQSLMKETSTELFWPFAREKDMVYHMAFVALSKVRELEK